LNNPIYKNKVCVVHTGEGTDKRSFDEINKLIKYNLLKRDLIGVHAVAMDAAQAKNFKGLVWCPESNGVLLNKHVNIKQLKTHTTFVFGTDSTLTGSWNIWEHLRLAKSLHQVADAELFNMVTRSPAKLWNMNNGSLQPKKDADIVVLRRRNESSTWDEFFKTDPEDILLVIQKGRIRLFDKSLLPQFLNLPINHLSYSQISIQGKIKFVEGDLPALVTEIRGYNRDIILPLDIY
jgi:cytosine/adenosine deaminase-related metal-dependent hydrolase